MLRYGTSIHNVCIAGYCRYGHLWPPQEKCSIMHGCIMPSSEVFWSKRTRFALRPFGGSVVILMQFCSNWMGNLGWQDLTGSLQTCSSYSVPPKKSGWHIYTSSSQVEHSSNIIESPFYSMFHLFVIYNLLQVQNHVSQHVASRPAAWELGRTRGKCGTSRGDFGRRSSQWAFPDLEANGRIDDLVRSVLELRRGDFR